MSTPEIEAETARAETLIEAGDLAGARAVADAIVAAHPGQPSAHNLLGFVAYREGRLIEAQREFEHACSLPGADDDMRANLEAVRHDLATVYSGGEGGAPPPDPAAPGPDVTHDFAGTLHDLRASLYGTDISPRLLGKLLARPVAPELDARLDGIPTATTVLERRFLLRYVAYFWDGQGDVFENGPLLGGTTRALAFGMLAHADRDKDTLLHTHDWFSSRVELDLPPGTFEQMAARGTISGQIKREMEASGSFQALYDSLHAGQDYSPLVRSYEAYLPGHRGDVPAHGETVFEPPPGRAFSIVFVDGCKSWYGTRHWIERMCDRIPAGSHVIMQDYGWYSCFWLPALIGSLPEHFRLVAHIDDTYAFELTRELRLETVVARFPDEPEDFGREAFDELFVRLIVDAGERNDIHSIVALTIQHAAALATLGLKDEARGRIEAMRGRPEFAAYRGRFIEAALRSPTYTPEGPVML